MSKTSIEWTGEVWNPTVGCTRISPGCKHCYAFALHEKRHAAKLAGKKLPAQYAKPFTELQLMPDRLEAPLHWTTPRVVFVNSVSDLFHKDVPFEFIDQVFAVMALAHQHTFQVLTKRVDRMAEYFDATKQEGGIGRDAYVEGEAQNFHHKRTGEDPSLWLAAHFPLPNVWLGASVENRFWKRRIDELRDMPAAVRFLSLEPLLEDVGTLDLRDIHWVITGCESGAGRRPFQQEWDESIEQQCREAGVAFFRKQIIVDGRVSNDMAEWEPRLRVRQFPKIESAVTA